MKQERRKVGVRRFFFRQTHVGNDHIGIFCVIKKLEVLRLHIAKCTRP